MIIRERTRPAAVNQDVVISFLEVGAAAHSSQCQTLQSGARWKLAGQSHFNDCLRVVGEREHGAHVPGESVLGERAGPGEDGGNRHVAKEPGDHIERTRRVVEHKRAGDPLFPGGFPSRDGGATWSELESEIRLFPYWTELYGTSNPLPIADGKLLWGCIGTTGRDAGWQAGVVVTGPKGEGFADPVIIAAAPDREYGDLDLVRLDDGRLLAVIREFTVKDAVYSHSSDEGSTWTPIRLTGFKAANIKLIRLRSGAILCAYRDEDPARPGVSCSVSDDGGESWRFVGQLYAAGSDQTDLPGSPCGYPDLVSLGDGQLLGILHTYPDVEGQLDLFQFRLVDRS